MIKKPDTDSAELKVLVLEDSERDLELMREQLSNAGYHLDLTHVENEADFTNSLRGNSFDLILSDYKLPGFDAFGALHISQEICPLTPFICISGTIGEETAVELLKLGAVDYVSKERPERLPMAVKRALEGAKIKADYQKATEALRVSEEKMRSIYSVAPAGIGVVINRVLKEVNPRICEMIGYAREELLEKNARILYPSQEEYEFVGKEKYAQIAANGTGEVETLWQKKDGTIINVFMASTPIDINDLSRGVTFTVLDITERKKSEQLLTDQKELLAAIFRNAPLVMMVVNSERRIQRINGFASQFAGRDAEEILGMRGGEALRCLHVLDDPKGCGFGEFCKQCVIRNTVIDTLETGETNLQIEAPYFFKGEDNQIQEMTLLTSTTPIMVKGERMVLVTLQDITDRKRSEIIKQLQYNIAKAMIATKNPNELFDSVQNELNRIMDARNFMVAFYNEGTGMLRSLVERDEKDEMPEWSAEKSATGYVITKGQTVLLKKEDVLQLKNKGVINVVGTPSEAWLGVPLKIEGKIIGAIVVQNYDNPDIYDQQSIEMMELVAHLLSMYMGRLRAEEKARESDKLKSAFLKNISHEIRTPLNGILGFGGLLSEKDHSSEVKKEMLSVVIQSSNRLLNTVTDYIDMARIVSDTMGVHKKKFYLQPIIEEAVQEVKLQCEVKNISLQTNIPKQCGDICLFSDKELIHKTLHILLDNALKFTSQGKIICGCRMMPEFVELYVEDTGIGITDDKLEMVFDNFVQEDSSDTRAHEGSGLGLSIARGLVHLLGGTIAVTSKKGKGSTFTFTVPYNETTTAEKNRQSEEKKSIHPPGKPLVLLAEDDESNYLYMEEVLQQAECDYLLAKNGEEAVALCKKHPEITLILMDIKMPVMDGLEATRRIREFRSEVPIIATTAYAQTGDEQRFLSAGCDGYLPKPIGLEKLMPLLNGHME